MRLVPGAGDIGAEGGGADVVELRLQRARSGRSDDRLERGQHALALRLAERDQPHAGGDPIGGDRLQIGGQRRVKRDVVAGGGDRHRDRIGDRAVPNRFEPVERGAGPGGARRLDKGIALRGGLQMALLRRRQRRGQLGDRAQRLVVPGRCGTMRVRKQHGVAEAAALGEHHGQPGAQRLGVADVARLHRPLDAAGIGEGADRIGRRQPGHQAIEGGRCDLPAQLPAQAGHPVHPAMLRAALSRDSGSPLARGRADAEAQTFS